MCTLSLLRSNGELCITMNRDEVRERNEAGLYSAVYKGIEYCYPVDARSGGTWAGINSEGVNLCLLNRYQTPTISDAQSRGGIIPKALQHGSFKAILTYMRSLDTAVYNGFDCVVSDLQHSVQFSWDRQHYSELALASDTAIMLTSSSVRLDEISAYRKQLFELWLNKQHANTDISAFHLQQAENQASEAVFMSREPTHTKSITRFGINAQQSHAAYYEHPQLQANITLNAIAPSKQWFS